MLIPTKFSGYQAGIRLYPGGGGGGGGGGDGGTPGGETGSGDTGNATDSGATAAGPAIGGDSGVGAGGGPNDFSTSQQTSSGRGMFGNLTGDNGYPYQISPNYGATRTAPQPNTNIYQPQYTNYANPFTAFNVSTYGMQPMGFNNYGGGFNPYAMQTPFNPYAGMYQTPFNPYAGMYQSPFSMPMAQSAPARPIVSRSAQVRGTPNVMMRRASGGIADLLSKK